MCCSKGESPPQEGTVYKHPSLRVGYVSQHATHHIGETGSSCVYDTLIEVPY